MFVFFTSWATSENLARACRHFLLVHLAGLGLVNWFFLHRRCPFWGYNLIQTWRHLASQTHIKFTHIHLLLARHQSATLSLLGPLGIGIKCPGTKLSWQLGNLCNGQHVYGTWHAMWHINCLKFLAVFLALRAFCYNLCTAGGNGLGPVHKIFV